MSKEGLRNLLLVEYILVLLFPCETLTYVFKKYFKIKKYFNRKFDIKLYPLDF